MTADEVEQLEKATRGQSKNKLWMQHRAGRITASRCKDVLLTNPDMPSQTLIKSICYPDAYTFSTEATG